MSITLARCSCAAAVLAVLASAQQASAYCRSNTCKDANLCLQDDQPVGDCKPFRWPGNCIGFAVQEDASDEVTFKQISDAADIAFRTWQDAPCGAGTPGIRVQNFGPVACSEVELNARDGKTRVVDGLVPGNANVITFRDMRWLESEEHDPSMLALTTVQFDRKTGEIWGADMEINTDLFDFSTEEAAPPPKFDLLAVVTHEAGHFLGLDHTMAGEEATMHFRYDPQDASAFRSLHPDDIAGICQIYPPRDLSTEECNPIPPHGFSPECAEDQLVKCGVARAPGGGRWWSAPFAAAAAALGAAALRRAGGRGGRRSEGGGRSGSGGRGGGAEAG
ncbi:exported protease [Sorangium cellulosum]|uniref:Exported protease n=1 Tax=Sorangium cellulosum TaxID=56 RepID=A0A2L0F4L8_SORCE|nr:matrixin family metalloprotease [Sorangium cellulosum]AUX46514.1 exported protease [Sorangium cellulosum]